MQTGDEQARINLWLVNGMAPTNNQEVEVVIKSFQFVPLGFPQPATLAPVGGSSVDGFQFIGNGQFNRRYQYKRRQTWSPGNH